MGDVGIVLMAHLLGAAGVLAIALGRALLAQCRFGLDTPLPVSRAPTRDDADNGPANCQDYAGPTIAFELRESGRVDHTRDHMGPRWTDLNYPVLHPKSTPSKFDYTPSSYTPPRPEASQSESRSPTQAKAAQNSSWTSASTGASQADSQAASGLQRASGILAWIIASMLGITVVVGGLLAWFSSKPSHTPDSGAATKSLVHVTLKRQPPTSTPEITEPRTVSTDTANAHRTVANTSATESRGASTGEETDMEGPFGSQSEGGPPAAVAVSDNAPQASSRSDEPTEPVETAVDHFARSTKEERRTWTDTAGRTVQAACLGLDNNTVVLSVGDRLYQIRLERLSREDLIYLVSRAAASALTDRHGKQLAVRTWTDSTGEFRTQAVLISVTPSSVRLLQSDGRLLVVLQDRLSEEDQLFLRLRGPDKTPAEQVPAVRLPSSTPMPELPRPD